MFLSSAGSTGSATLLVSTECVYYLTICIIWQLTAIRRSIQLTNVTIRIVTD